MVVDFVLCTQSAHCVFCSTFLATRPPDLSSVLHMEVTKKKLDALMKKLDTDGDGQITLEEFRVLFKEMSTK